MLATCSWHAQMFDLIGLILHQPCKTILHLCKHIECMYPNIYVCAIVNEDYSEYNKTHWCNYALRDLITRGCNIITNLDDDEFYVTPIHMVKKSTEETIFYQTGNCYYQTEIDRPDCNPVRSMLYRDAAEPRDYDFKKWICPSRIFVSTTAGNHYVKINRAVNSVIVPQLKIYHYTYRKKQLNNNNYVPLTYDKIKEKNLVYDDSLVKLLDARNTIV